MATQAEDYIPRDFEQQMKDAEKEPTVLDETFETITEAVATSAPVQMVRELLYEPPIKYAIVGFASGAITTILIFMFVILVTKTI